MHAYYFAKKIMHAYKKVITILSVKGRYYSKFSLFLK